MPNEALPPEPNLAEMEQIIREEQEREAARRTQHEALIARLQKFLARSKGNKEQVDDTEPVY